MHPIRSHFRSSLPRISIQSICLVAGCLSGAVNSHAKERETKEAVNINGESKFGRKSKSSSTKNYVLTREFEQRSGVQGCPSAVHLTVVAAHSLVTIPVVLSYPAYAAAPSQLLFPNCFVSFRVLFPQNSSARYISRGNVNTNTGASQTFQHSSSLVPFLPQAIPPHNRRTDQDYR